MILKNDSKTPFSSLKKYKKNIPKIYKKRNTVIMFDLLIKALFNKTQSWKYLLVIDI